MYKLKKIDGLMWKIGFKALITKFKQQKYEN